MQVIPPLNKMLTVVGTKPNREILFGGEVVAEEKNGEWFITRAMKKVSSLILSVLRGLIPRFSYTEIGESAPVIKTPTPEELYRERLREENRIRYEKQEQEALERRKKWFGDMTNEEVKDKMRELRKQYPDARCSDNDNGGEFCPANPSGTKHLYIAFSNDLGCPYCGCVVSRHG